MTSHRRFLGRLVFGLKPRGRPLAYPLGAVGAIAVVGITVVGCPFPQSVVQRQAERAATQTPPPSPDAVPDSDLAQRGSQLYQALRCGSCHEPGVKQVVPGLPPDLSYAGSKLHQDWMARYLLDPAPIRWLRQGVRPVIRMPDFNLTDGESAALAAHLATRRQPARFDSVVDPEVLSSASVSEGRQLFEQYRCRGCHVLDGQGNRVGPELSAVGSRLRPGYVFVFLSDPDSVIPGTPMVQTVLWEEEAAALARFLETCR